MTLLLPVFAEVFSFFTKKLVKVVLPILKLVKVVLPTFRNSGISALLVEKRHFRTF